MEKLWGGIDPIDPDRIQKLTDGDTIDLGARRLDVVETLGHAGHHHAFLDSESGTLFTGDALGVRLQDVGVFRPATPPPEFNLEMAVSSIERMRKLAPATLCPTHFDGIDSGKRPVSVDEACAQAIEVLRKWESWVTDARKETMDVEEVARHVKEAARHAFEGDMAEAEVDRMEQTTSYRMNTQGYMRYLDKREAAS